MMNSSKTGLEKAVYDKIEIRRPRLETMQMQTVSFDCPVTVPYLIPVIHNSTPSCINVPFMVEGTAYNVTSFSLDKPFGVVIIENIDKIDISITGKALSTHPLFPKGADIVFLEVESKDLLKARLYSKEDGETGFSERGACAAFVAARMLDKSYGSALVAMSGKTCRVEWDGVAGNVRLTESKS